MATMDDELRQQLDQALGRGTPLPSGVRINFGDPEPFQAIDTQTRDAGQPDETPNLKAMKRAELEAHAVSIGIEGPDNRDRFPNVDALIAAIEGQ
jgi:hypothetical protein